MAGRKKSDVVEFAIGFAKITGVNVDFKSSEFRKLLAQAKKLKSDGYDLGVALRVLKAISISGKSVTTPYAITWMSPDRVRNWYDFSRPSLPPLYDGLNLYLVENGGMPHRFN